MMHAVTDWCLLHVHLAPWLIALCIILAGINFPFSIDLLLAFAAFIAVEASFAFRWGLYLIFLVSCIVSAVIAYSLGRFLGYHYQKIPLLRKIATEKRIKAVQNSYMQYGIWTYIVGRFIPFGVRNAIFISSGITRVPFFYFLLGDSIGCVLWSLSFYLLFMRFCPSLEEMTASLQHINLVIFLCFSVTLIVFICYKYIKHKKARKNDNNFESTHTR